MQQAKPGECVIFDIDGTLAEIKHRRHFISHGASDWRSFSESMVTDTVHEPVRRLCNILFEAGFVVFLFSGREEEYREVTEIWLDHKQIRYHHLHMRANKDYRQDSVIKREMLYQHIPDKSKILFVVDDRQQVVEMWRSEEILCLQCAPGDF